MLTQGIWLKTRRNSSLEEEKDGMVEFSGGKKGKIWGFGKIWKIEEHSIEKV